MTREIESWTNSLGMRFVNVPGTKVLFSAWKTRVQDFQVFANETQYDATNRFHHGIRGQYERTWRDPGFKQGHDHPVCWVSWNDAKTFCSWLTKRERRAGVIGPGKIYRLPTDSEWSAAVGDKRYCWGDEWPPPAGAGNFAGDEALDSNWPTDRPTLPGYRDDFPHTSPVGSFSANAFGLYDLAGNLGEWCEDQFHKEMNPDDIRKQKPDIDRGSSDCRVLRGASWHAASPLALAAARRGWGPPATAGDDIGFRVVLSSEEAEKPPSSAWATKSDR